ncbi:MAG: LysM peptidoglycan-binding domain-containing protein [Chloroflexota bacterium]
MNNYANPQQVYSGVERQRRTPKRCLLLLLVMSITVLMIVSACTRSRPTPEPTPVIEGETAASENADAPLALPQGDVAPEEGAGDNSGSEPVVATQDGEDPTDDESPEDELPDVEIPKTIAYTVLEGESLSYIAEKFNTEMETIRRLNFLLDDNIFTGQVLDIPYTDGMTAEGLPTPTPPPYTYVIEEKDTLSGIALKFDVPIVEIIASNVQLDPNSLFVGQEIIIPGYQPPAGGAVGALNVNPSAGGNTIAAEDQVRHVVQPGEGLYEIAVKYDVDISAIANANKLTDRNLLRVGQELIIPGVSQLDIIIANSIIHVVEVGDSLSGIAVQYGVTTEALVELNELDNENTIYIGQELIIPGQ